MPLVIDGHNLLWSIHKPGKDHDHANDIQLCHLLARYLKLTGETAVIVFDGAGPSDKSAFDNISGLEVVFAGLSADADTVIEDKIKANTAPKRMTVVSSDRRLRAAARARKATAVKSEVFWRSLQKKLSRKESSEKSEPSAKRLGLSSAETEQWLKFFNLDQ